jgi:N-carbamoyl-L-amino-acid hydrolase
MSTDINNLRVNGQRLWDSLMELAQIGATPKGGVCRLTLTDLDKQGRDLVSRWAKEAGMTVTIDKIGNGFLRRPGKNNSLPPVMTGSHIDTQPTGGKFDGNYGVLAGLEVVRTLNDNRHPDRSPDRGGLVDQRRRLALRAGDDGLGCVRQGLHAGTCLCRQRRRGQDASRKNWKRIGYIGRQEPGDHPIGSYFETHIEQGPVLEDNAKTIGVVTGVLGIRWYDCVVTGMEAHAGPTPMALRKDALQVASKLMQEVVACAHRHPQGRIMGVARSAWCGCTPTAAT